MDIGEIIHVRFVQDDVLNADGERVEVSTDCQAGIISKVYPDNSFGVHMFNQRGTPAESISRIIVSLPMGETWHLKDDCTYRPMPPFNLSNVNPDVKSNEQNG